MKFIVDNAKVKKIAAQLKVGYEFTFTNAACAADDIPYGDQSREYETRKELCKEEMRVALISFANYLLRKYKSKYAHFATCIAKNYTVHEDPGVIEISAPPTRNVKLNKELFDLLHEVAEKHGFAPYYQQECGGMHANVDTITAKRKQVPQFYTIKEARKLSNKRDRLHDLSRWVRSRYDRIIRRISADHDRVDYINDRLENRYIRDRYFASEEGRNILERIKNDVLVNAAIVDKLYTKRANICRAIDVRILRCSAQHQELEQAYNAKHEKDFAILYLHGIAINYMLNAFPAVVWTFHAPNDDESALIQHEDCWYTNGKSCAARFNPECEKFVEYRCVGMVGNSNLMELVDTFFRRFTAWAHINEAQIEAAGTKNKQPKKFVHSAERLHKFNLKKATRQFYHVCRMLDLNPIDYRWFLENHLAIRFSYDQQYHHAFTR